MPSPLQSQLVVLSGPAGSGKTTLAESVLRRRPDLVHRALTATTRAPRPGEVDGEDYLFLSHEQFAEGVRSARFVEHKLFNGHFYGCPRDTLEEALRRPGLTLLVIEVDGAESIRFFFPNAAYVFLAPPSQKALRERLTRRGTETGDQLEGRLLIARQEMARLAEYDLLIVNNDLEVAVADLEAALQVIARSRIVGGEAEAWEQGGYEGWR